MPKGRPRLTLQTDPDRATLVAMEGAIRKGDHPPGGYAAAGAAAGAREGPYFAAKRDRLYRKYRHYREELSRLPGAEGEPQSIDDIETYTILAEVLAGEKPAVKIAFMTRYLEITRQNNYVIEEVQRRFQAQGKPLSREELKDFLMTALTIVDIELKQAGVSQKISTTMQKLIASGKALPPKKEQEETDEKL
jgi:hypothetical protein